ncbi:MAG: pilus assembly protein [Lachnospiraceae bacterium]|nr:pilus assembly protein [Lachnospiraceae bacterium]
MTRFTRRVWKKLREQGGAVQIVEATIVFPVAFFILFFLIFMGNAYFAKARVEATVEKYAIMGAAYCSDPILQTIKENGYVPSLKTLQTKPYRFIFGGNGDVEKKVREELQAEFSSGKATFFKGMKPRLVNEPEAKFHNYVVYSTFSVEVKYDIQFPIRFLGSKTPTVLHFSARSEMPVQEQAEFIRNTDMVLDYFQGTGIGKKIEDVFAKINGFLSSFAEK